MDGTFESCPTQFHQVYSIHALKNDQSNEFELALLCRITKFYIGFVCVIALLSAKTAFIYKELFGILTNHARRLELQFRPSKITTDFETALIKTISEEV